MQLLFAVFREETCTYSWAVAQQSLESFHSFGMKKYDEQSNNVHHKTHQHSRQHPSMPMAMTRTNVMEMTVFFPYPNVFS